MALGLCFFFLCSRATDLAFMTTAVALARNRKPVEENLHACVEQKTKGVCGGKVAATFR